jgi:large subunit ribosomal protein L47
MLAFVRTVPKRIPRPMIIQPAIRALADVVAALPNHSTISAPPAPASPKNVHVLSKERISVREDHGLYAFFRRKEDANLVGDARYEVVETPEIVQRVTGRFFFASFTLVIR